MTKYFELDTLVDSLDKLREANGKWALVGLVLAMNGVTSNEITNISSRKGSDRALDTFVAGQQIGLEPRNPGGKVNLRPLFKDLTTQETAGRAMTVDYAKLWSSTLSQSGYAAMRDNETLMRTSGSEFQLGPKFSENLSQNLGTQFRFEHFLVWLYAFRGLPDSVGSWNDLLADFESNFTWNGIPAEFRPAFDLAGDVPWPTRLLDSRPSNLQYQERLTPELATISLTAEDWRGLRSTLADIIKSEFDGYSQQAVESLSRSLLSGLRGGRRVFLLGEPGTGKSQLARMVIGAFERQFGDRVHSVFVPISDSTTPDKLIGFSTLDGRWIDGELTRAESDGTSRRLLHPIADAVAHRRQINVLVLDEANRRDIEELLAKLQLALDSTETSPDSSAFRIGLDNSGEQVISPNTYVLMTGNSPREDSGRLAQSRPFKRRQNLVVVENVFAPALASADSLKTALRNLWQRVNDDPAAEFGDHVIADENQQYIEGLRSILESLQGHRIGVSYGLIAKVLRTSAARFELGDTYGQSLDHGFTEAVLPLLATESSGSDGPSMRESLEGLAGPHQVHFPQFFQAVTAILQPPDALGRVRAFL